MKPYPAYKNSGIDCIGEIPKHWNCHKMKWSLGALESGNRETGGGNQLDDGIFSIGGEHIGWLGELLLSNPKYISENYYDNLNTGKIKKSDILLVKDGATIGKTAIVRELPFEKCAVNEHVFIIRGNQITECRYLYYLVSGNVGQEQIKLEIRGSAQGGLNSQFVNKVYIPNVPSDEQQAIADFLDKKTALIDSLVEKKKRQIELLKEQRQAVINQAVTKGLDPDTEMKDSGVEWIGKIPKHWDIIKVKYLFNLITEQAPLNNDCELLSLYTDIGVKPRKELEARGNKASTTDGYWMVLKGDIVVNKLLAWMGAIGHSDYDGVTSPAYDILRKKTDLNSKFYHYLFRCGLYLTEFRRRSRGIMDMRLRLYFDELGQILVVYPPSSEQDKIVEYINRLNADTELTISKAERQIELLQEYRTALMSEVVTGKVDVREAV